MNKEIGGCDGGGGGGGDGGSSGNGGGGGGSCRTSSSLRQTSDMFGVRESGPPAFLTKTYNIVDDPNTNSIISWGKSGNSFIIYDHLQFSADILPKYFRHNNLSSFVYQLNNYGFRKIGTDYQWEYENPNFQSGKVHLLKNMKRRGQRQETQTRRCGKRTLDDSVIRPEIQRNETNESKLEMEKLKRQQADLEFHIMALEEEVKNVENNTKKLILHWAEACVIIAHKMREENGKQNCDDEARKKRKLDTPENNEIDLNLDGNNNQDHDEMVKEDAIPLSENQLVSSTNDSGSQVLDDRETNANCEATLEKNSTDYTFWKAILLDDVEDYEGEAGNEMANKQAKIALDLEDLILKLDD